jgi:hypothetical protein
VDVMEAGRSGAAVAWKEIASSGGVASLCGRQSKGLEEVEGSGGSQHEALETAGSSGGGRKLWRREEALEPVEGSLWRRSEGLEEVRASGGGRKLWRQYGTKLWRQQEALGALKHEGSMKFCCGTLRSFAGGGIMLHVAQGRPCAM